MTHANPQRAITYSSIVHDDFSNFTLEFHNVKKGYALKINDKYLNLDASFFIISGKEIMLDVNDSNYDASIFTKNVDNATMFSILRSNDSRILNYGSNSTNDVETTLNYVATNDTNVYYITIEYEGNSYLITYKNEYAAIGIFPFMGQQHSFLGANYNEIQQWYIPDYTNSLFLTKNN